MPNNRKNRGNKQPNKGNPKAGPKGNGKRPNKGQGGKGRGGRTNEASIYEPNRPLTKDSLRKAVEETVNFQIQPTLRLQNRALGELTKQRESDLSNISRFGNQATTNVGTYYEKLAAQEAQQLAEQKASGGVQTAAVAQSGANTQGAIATAGSAAQEGIGAYEGQSIAARDRLAKMIAEQQATAAQNSDALNAQAQGQAAGFNNFLTGLKSAAGMRGGEQLGDIGRQVQNRLTEANNEYGKEIGKVRNDKLDLLRERPELAKKALMELREKEQNNSLSRAALGIKKEQAANETKSGRSGVEYAKVNARELMRVKKLEHRQRLQELAAAGASNQELAEIKSQQSKEIIELQQEGYGKGGGKSGAGGYQPFGKTFSYLRNSPVSPKTLAMSKKARKAAYDKLRVYGASDKIAKKVIKKYIKQYARRLAKDPNGVSIGR